MMSYCFSKLPMTKSITIDKRLKNYPKREKINK